MNFSLVYLAHRFFYRLFDFFHHWYADGSRWFGRKFIGTLRELDKTFAVKVTFEHFFEPLYGDYTVIGRILGAVFRTFRTAIGLAVYAVLTVAMAILYIIWLAIPAYVAWRIVRG